MARLFTPGPVEVPREVLEACARKVVFHRSEEFHELYTRVTEKLMKVLKSSSGEVLVMPGSGTTAVDAMAWSLVWPGERVLALVHGEFGRRFVDSLRRRGAKVDVLESEPGGAVPPEEALSRLESGGYDVLAVVHNETSTGLAYRVLAKLIEEASKLGVRVLVDAVSGLAGEHFELRGGSVAVAGCSHKALAAPPGVAFVALTAEAAETLERRGTPENTPPILDLARYHRFGAKKETPFTPPVTLLYAFEAALDRVLRVGVDAYVEEHRRRASILYTRLPRMGYEPLVRAPEYRSNTTTAFKSPLPASKVKKALLEKGFAVATGMGELKEEVLRIGTMGAITVADVEELVEALREVTEALTRS